MGMDKRGAQAGMCLSPLGPLPLNDRCWYQEVTPHTEWPIPPVFRNAVFVTHSYCSYHPCCLWQHGTFWTRVRRRIANLVAALMYLMDYSTQCHVNIHSNHVGIYIHCKRKLVSVTRPYSPITNTGPHSLAEYYSRKVSRILLLWILNHPHIMARLLWNLWSYQRSEKGQANRNSPVLEC